MNNIPLRVEFPLATPWVPPEVALHLDGLIAWALVQDVERRTGKAVTNFDAVLADLPFGKFETEDGWVWQASMVRAHGVRGSERRYMTAKTASESLSVAIGAGKILGRPLTAIDTVRGEFKNDAFWYSAQTAERCIGYCIGDPERIAPLLGYITHIGAQRKLDHGRVAGDPILEEDEAATTEWQRRYMPVPSTGLVAAEGRLRPPYWLGPFSMVWRPAE